MRKDLRKAVAVVLKELDWRTPKSSRGGFLPSAETQEATELLTKYIADPKCCKTK